MEKIYEQTMLYDFYGELLTDHQRSIYEDVVYNDMSLGEIAEERGISRQGVHDLIRRCDRILQEYESKLHLVERFARAKETVTEIRRLAGSAISTSDSDQTGIMDLTSITDPDGQELGANPAAAESVENDSEKVFNYMAERMQRISNLAQELMEEL